MLFQSKFFYSLRELVQRASFRIMLYTAYGALSVFLAEYLGPKLPVDKLPNISIDMLSPVLSSMGSAMLAVTTFSLGIIASGIAASAQSTTPRASQLLLSDKRSQSVLAAFLGTSIYCYIANFFLRAGLMGPGGRVIVTVFTLLVFFQVYFGFIRWINHLRTFGRIGDTLERVEKETTNGFNLRQKHPALGCNFLNADTDIPKNAVPLYSPKSQYIRHIDFGVLNQAARLSKIDVYIMTPPGAFVYETHPVCYLSSDVGSFAKKSILRAFTFGTSRDFYQDPSFGAVVFSETASRAMSPAVNDPGTAIDCLRRFSRAMTYAEKTPKERVRYHHLWMSPLDIREIFKSIYAPVSRDSAGNLEVQRALLLSLNNIANHNRAEYFALANEYANYAMSYARLSMVNLADLAELESEFTRLGFTA